MPDAAPGLRADAVRGRRRAPAGAVPARTLGPAIAALFAIPARGDA
jgi:hypothetical protein